MDPPPESFISGAQVWMPRTVAVTLISKVLFHSSMSISGNMFSALDPTMFMSTCRPPACFLTCSTAASHWSWLTTSSSIKCAFPPVSLISAARVSPCSWLRPAMNTVAPSLANSRAEARPMPP